MRDPAFDPPQDSDDAGSVPASDPRATPSMAQYVEIEDREPGLPALLQDGRFLRVVLSGCRDRRARSRHRPHKRGKHAGEDIPMCGVRVQRSDDYLHRLIDAGYRVAVCEQMGRSCRSPQTGSKAVVRRDVVRIGDTRNDHRGGPPRCRRANVLAAFSRQKRSETQWDYALAAVDMSTSDFTVQVSPRRICPARSRGSIRVNSLCRMACAMSRAWRRCSTRPGFSITRLPREGFDPASAERRIADYFAVAALDAFGDFTRPELSAIAAIIAYLERTQLGSRPPLTAPRRRSSGEAHGHRCLDAGQCSSLSARSPAIREGSLLSVIDRTVDGLPAEGSWRNGPQRLRPSPPWKSGARREGVSAFFEGTGSARGSAAWPAEGGSGYPGAPLTRIALDRAGPRGVCSDLRRPGLKQAEEIAARLVVAQGVA